MEPFMVRSLKTLLSASVFAAALGIGFAFAEEREVNDIWWDVQSDDDGGDHKTCVAENFNDHPVEAVFDLFPAAQDPDGAPMPRTAVLTMKPYVTYKIYNWPEGSDAHCSLRSVTVYSQ
jgi:hypothetical protein